MDPSQTGTVRIKRTIDSRSTPSRRRLEHQVLRKVSITRERTDPDRARQRAQVDVSGMEIGLAEKTI